MLVLGGTGVLGGALCDRFRMLGYDVIATGRAQRPRGAWTRDGVEPHTLDLADEETWPETVRCLASRQPEVVVDAVGEYTPSSLHDDKSLAQRTLWVNSLARGRFLRRLVEELPSSSAVVRLESSLGEHPSGSDSLVSAAKAADRVVTLAVAQDCRLRGLPFGSLVLTAVDVSLRPRQRALFTERFGHEPPSPGVVAEAVAGLTSLIRLSPGAARLWFPWHGIATDPMAETWS